MPFLTDSKSILFSVLTIQLIYLEIGVPFRISFCIISTNIFKPASYSFSTTCFIVKNVAQVLLCLFYIFSRFLAWFP